MSASYVTVDVNFPILCTFSHGFKKYEADLFIAEDAPMMSKGEIVASNATSVPIFLCIFAV